MALFAGYNRVQANQWKTSNIMFKAYFSAPAFLIVTVFTIFPLLAFMYIIYLVTAVAVSLCFGFVDMFFVTGHTVCFGMFAAKFEFSFFIMIEARF